MVSTEIYLSFVSLHVISFIEFKEERKVLLEVIGPELQAIYDDRQIEVKGENFHFFSKLINFILDRLNLSICTSAREQYTRALI